MRFIIVMKSICAYQFFRDVYVRCGRCKLKTEKVKKVVQELAEAHLSPLMQYVLSFSSFTASMFSLGFLSRTCTLRAPFGIVTIFTYAAKKEE